MNRVRVNQQAGARGDHALRQHTPQHQTAPAVDTDRMTTLPNLDYLTPGQAMQLQRSIGNRRLQRLLTGRAQRKACGCGEDATEDIQREPDIQRVLEIKSRNKYFTSKTAAATYLTEKFEERLEEMANGKTPRKMKSAESERLNEIAATARDKRYVYPIETLTDALDYIETGIKLDIQRYDTDPSKTPERTTDDSDQWEFFVNTKYTPPSTLDVPQSPRRSHFPYSEIEEPHSTMDLRSDLKSVRDRISEWDDEITTKSHKGNNHYSYDVDIKYRLDPLEMYNDMRGTRAYRVVSNQYHPYARKRRGRYYTSKKMYPPQKRGEKPIDMEDEIRDKLTYMHDEYDYGNYRETSMYAKKGGVRTKDSDYYQRGRSKVGQLASLYFHSEVQAASDEDGAREISKQVVESMLRDARKKNKTNRNTNLVVVGVFIEGYSDHRTVCGNACKHALTDLSVQIENEINRRINDAKDEYRDDGIFIRRSSEYRVSAHIGAHTEFQGLEKGATTTRDKPTDIPHHQVYEYKYF